VKIPDAPDMKNEVTRRQWILRLGEMAVLAGVSGFVPAGATHLFGDEQDYATLPPGLYLPSAEHLVHVLGHTHALHPSPAGSETDYVQPGDSAGLQFFSPEEFRLITRFVEILLGKVSPDALAQTSHWIDLWLHSSEEVREAARHLDPLHRALAVQYFGEASVRGLETANNAAIVQNGLVSLQNLCREEHQSGFTDLDAVKQEEVVRRLSEAPIDSAQHKFFKLIRNEAIRGFYTSADGIKELDYKGNAYYPYCPGCELMQAKPPDP
jgi:gluconate 2-dehydrogenase subunit 3-like protein